MYYLLYPLVWLVSCMPFKVLYLISDFLYVLVYKVIKYRYAVIDDNLRKSFPEKSEVEIKEIIRQYYAFFCDYLVETMKLCTMSDKQMKERMEFVGVEEMVQALDQEKKQFAFLYLAHYGNWEWISSLSARVIDVNPEITGGHIYHPLRNEAFNRLFLKMRSRFKGINIPMKETLRFIMTQKRLHKKTIIGFIADQGPKWNSIHHWLDFMGRRTAVFTGTETIAKRVDALIFYTHVERVSRGHYRCIIRRMVDDVTRYPDFQITDMYFRHLEHSLHVQPAIWLWSHKRWKRTYEQYVQLVKDGVISRDGA